MGFKIGWRTWVTLTFIIVLTILGLLTMAFNPNQTTTGMNPYTLICTICGLVAACFGLFLIGAYGFTGSQSREKEQYAENLGRLTYEEQQQPQRRAPPRAPPSFSFVSTLL